MTMTTGHFVLKVGCSPGFNELHVEFQACETNTCIIVRLRLRRLVIWSFYRVLAIGAYGGGLWHDS